MKKYIVIILLALIGLGIIYFILNNPVSSYLALNENYKIETLGSALNQLENSNIQNSLFKNKRDALISEDEISFLNLLLMNSIKTYNSKKKKNEQIDLDEYRFYYVPMMTEKNEKLIFVFAYCSDRSREWLELSDLFDIRDGGNCYFRLVINLTNKTEGWVIANGEA